MPRYPKQDDPKGKKIIPSVTEIISDCTSDKHWAIPYGVNQACDWIVANCTEDFNWGSEEKFWEVYEDQLRYKRKDEKEYPNNVRYAHKHHSQKALDIGSEVHNAIEQYLLENKGFNKIHTKLSAEAMVAFGAFIAWSEEHNLQPIALEQTVYGDGWAGTLDFYGYFNDKLYVIDWKSSKAHYPEMRYQVAAYRRAVNGKLADKYLRIYGPTDEGALNYTKHKAIGCGVLRLDKETGLPDWKDTSGTYIQDLSIFNAMVDLYFKRHPKIAKKARG